MVLNSVQELVETQFIESSFGFRKGKGPLMARERLMKYIESGHIWVCYLDIVDNFDSIHPQDVIKSLPPPHNESNILSGYDGIPQGHFISPLLCNLYLNHFDIKMNEYSDPVPPNLPQASLC